MRPSERVWAGVDVGGRRKGFHVAVVGDAELLAGPDRVLTPRDVAAWLVELHPALVAVDSPRHAAPDGQTSRADERALARRVCGIRYTPDTAALRRNPRYYEWILHGLELYEALASAGLHAVECFPTAAWTRWLGPRHRQPRARWSTRALATLGLRGVPRSLGQDGRDAIAAAVTARACSRGEAEAFGEIVLPYDRTTRSSVRGGMGQ